MKVDPPQNEGDQLAQRSDNQACPLQRKSRQRKSQQRENLQRENRLLAEMLRQADPSQVAGLSRFFKTGPGQYGEGDQFLGIKVPVTRRVVKACLREVGLDDLEECIRSE